MTMPELISTQDHDLLIQLHTKMDVMLASLDTIRQLENSSTRHSEKIKAIEKSQLEDANSLVKRVERLETKSNLWDILNSFGVLVSAAIGYFLHK
jgi:hypothetical protein